MAKKKGSTTLANLTGMLEEAKKGLGPLAKQVEAVSKLIAETEQALAGYQEIADGLLVRKAKTTRTKAKRKTTRKSGRKKVAGVAKELKAYRKKAKLNQEGLAKKLGVHVASIRAWEQGRSNPRKAARQKIEALLQGKAGKPTRAKKTRKVRKTAATKAKATEQSKA